MDILSIINSYGVLQGVSQRHCGQGIARRLLRVCRAVPRHHDAPDTRHDIMVNVDRVLTVCACCMALQIGSTTRL